MMKTRSLRFVSERLNPAVNKIDRELGVVRDVVMFAPKRVGDYYVSEAGNYYADGFHEKAALALEGAPSWERHCFDRKVTEAIGRFKNVRLVEADGKKKVVGDFNVVKRHREAVLDSIAELADTVGFSIQAYTTGRFNKDGVFINEGFADTKRRPTCDLVDCSSATLNVFESMPPVQENDEEQPEENVMEIKTVEELRKEFPLLVEAAVKESAAATRAELKPQLEELESLRKESARWKRTALIGDLAKKHKLSADSISEAFRKTLEAIPEADVEPLIQELGKMVQQTKTGVTGNGIDRTSEALGLEKEGGRREILTEEKLINLLRG